MPPDYRLPLRKILTNSSIATFCIHYAKSGVILSELPSFHGLGARPSHPPGVATTHIIISVETYTPDTIAAISTPPGRGGIGIVRLSGPDAIALTTQLLRLTQPPIHARATFTRIPDPGNTDPTSPSVFIDEALTTAFLAPHSYTGEDLVEIAAHGSPVILETLLRTILTLSIDGRSPRLANPGEFTQRAFLSGRLDLTQAEAVHDLIAAQTLDQARSAAQQLGGALSRRIAPAKETLLHLIALLEAGMDFASGELDDVDVVPPTHIAAAITSAITPLQTLADTFRRGQLLRNGAAIALIGLPNAGKSSVFNRLLDRDRAIVTPIPGTTRDTLEESIALAGIPLRLIDTAGLRSSISPSEPATPLGAPSSPTAPSSVRVGSQDLNPTPTSLDLAEQLGIARTHEALADADLILFVHDATLPLTPEEHTLIASFTTRPHLLILNKTDLVESAPTDNTWLPTSALTGLGLDHLRQAILHQLNATGALAETALLNNLRQHEAITSAIAALATAAEANAAGIPHELLLLDLHSALRHLDALTGITTTDDILARIFSTFCIGK
jgi:tRNA modification GTPase